MIGKDQIETVAGRTEYHARSSSVPTSQPCCWAAAGYHSDPATCYHSDTRCCKTYQCEHPGAQRAPRAHYDSCGDFVVNGRSHREPVCDMNPQPPPRGMSSAQSVQALSNKLKAGNYVMTPELRRKFQRKQSRDGKTPSCPDKQTNSNNPGSPNTDSPNSSVRSEGDGHSIYTTRETTPPPLLDTAQITTPPPRGLQRTKYSLADIHISNKGVSDLQKLGKKYKSMSNVADVPECDVAYLKEELISRLIKEKERLLELKRLKQEQRERGMQSRLQEDVKVDRTLIIENTPESPSTPPSRLHPVCDVTTRDSRRQPVCTTYDTPVRERSRDIPVLRSPGYLLQESLDRLNHDKIRTSNDSSLNNVAVKHPHDTSSVAVKHPHDTSSVAVKHPHDAPKTRTNFVELKSDAAAELLKSQSTSSNVDRLDQNKSLAAKSWTFDEPGPAPRHKQTRQLSLGDHSAVNRVDTMFNMEHHYFSLEDLSTKRVEPKLFLPQTFVPSPSSGCKQHVPRPTYNHSSSAPTQYPLQYPVSSRKMNPCQSPPIPCQSPPIPRRKNNSQSPAPVSRDSHHAQSPDKTRQSDNSQPRKSNPFQARKTSSCIVQSPPRSRKSHNCQPPPPSRTPIPPTLVRSPVITRKHKSYHDHDLSPSSSRKPTSFPSPPTSRKSNNYQAPSRKTQSQQNLYRESSVPDANHYPISSRKSNLPSSHSQDMTSLPSVVHPIYDVTETITNAGCFPSETYNERAVDCPKEYVKTPPGVDVIRSLQGETENSVRRPAVLSNYRRKKKSQKDKCHTQ